MRFARQIILTGLRSFSSSAQGQSSFAGAGRVPPAGADPLSAVKGLSQNCVATPSGPVGPGAKSDGTYKVPEYFSYNQMSYFEAEIEMEKYRCPQPDSGKQQ